MRELGEAGRHQLEPREQRLGRKRDDGRRSRSRRPRPDAPKAASWPAAVSSMPAHITGATAGSAARFAGIDTSGTASKWSASSGVVATVATAVSHRAPAIGPRGASGRAATIPATAANESCQPASPATRGFAASVTAAASSSAYEADAGRDTASATSPAAPITAAR